MSTRRLIGAGLAVAMIVLLVGLGVWQLERRTWKLALIEQVERRLAAAPVVAPGPEQWPGIGRDDAYTRVHASGRLLAGRDTYVQAVTDLGGGYWVLTPLRTSAGWTLLVNRGFVPADMRGRAPPPGQGEATVSGLLRITEPGGGFLRRNDPQAARWYSRDVAAIAASQRLGRTAPYFVDADRTGAGWPRGGMTVIRFPNSHLVYALTWFALAALIGLLAFRAMRRQT